jgi:CheY-like chemotaxis protein
VPILVVTGDRRDAQWRRALRSGASVVLTKPTTADEVWTDTQRPIDEMADARTRPAERDRPDRPEPHQGAPHRTSRSNTFSRFQTTAPAMPAPAFLSPTCDRPLVCTNSYAGGVTEQQREQWDRYVCPDVCGELDYRHRTRHVRHLA